MFWSKSVLYLTNQQVSSATARRKQVGCTRCWRCPMRGRTCPWWSFCRDRRCHWLPWSQSSRRRCWRSGPTMSNGKRWRCTCPGEGWREHTGCLLVVFLCRRWACWVVLFTLVTYSSVLVTVNTSSLQNHSIQPWITGFPCIMCSFLLMWRLRK